jgi:hypothetical protein
MPMKVDLIKLGTIALGSWLAVGAWLLPASATASADARQYRFEVYLDDRRIGEHLYEITGAAGEERVRSQASFEFKLLFVTLYRYRHLANERWQKGCLTELTSVTDDNGKSFEIEAGRSDAQLLLTRKTPDRQTLEIPSNCPATFAYWDLQRLNVGALINTQTGDLSATRLIREDDEEIDGQVATRYRLEVEGLSALRLWYRAGDDAWLRLSTLRDGRLLEYRRVEVLPQTAEAIRPAAAGATGR